MRRNFALFFGLLLLGCESAGTTQLLEKRFRDGGGDFFDVSSADVIDFPDIEQRDLGDPPFDADLPDSGELGVARLLVTQLDFGTHLDGSSTRLEIDVRGDPRFVSRTRVLRIRGPGEQNLRTSPTIGQPLDLSPGEIRQLVVFFEPAGSGSREAVIEIETCAEGCVDFVRVNAVASEDPLDCAPIDFGTVSGPCTLESFACVNIVGDIIELRSTEITPPGSAFNVVNVATPVVAPGQTFNFDLRYCPPDATVDQADLAFGFVPQPLVGAGGATEVIPLTGLGAGMSGCRVSFDMVIEFRDVPVGTLSERVSAINNLGTTNCELNFLGLTGTSTAFQQISPAPGLISIPPGGQAQIVMRFDSQLGSFMDRTRVRTSDPFTPLIDIVVIGNGVLTPPGFRIETSTAAGPLVLTPGMPLTFSPSQDDGSVSVPIPFNFSFLQQPQTAVIASSNGFITFQSAGTTTMRPQTIPSSQPPNALIAFWWMDLFPYRPNTMGQVVLSTTGVAPSRVLRIGWSQVAPFGGNAAVAMNAEMRLFETTNIVEVHYGEVVNAAMASPWRAATGWESFGGVTGAYALPCQMACSVANWPANTLIRYIPTP